MVVSLFSVCFSWMVLDGRRFYFLFLGGPELVSAVGLSRIAKWFSALPLWSVAGWVTGKEVL